jgi:hypothetical protein
VVSTGASTPESFWVEHPETTQPSISYQTRDATKANAPANPRLRGDMLRHYQAYRQQPPPSRGQALMRRAAGKHSMRVKRRLAAWDDAYLVSLVSGAV